jgi:hypothetical protein
MTGSDKPGQLAPEAIAAQALGYIDESTSALVAPVRVEGPSTPVPADLLRLSIGL